MRARQPGTVVEDRSGDLEVVHDVVAGIVDGHRGMGERGVDPGVTRAHLGDEIVDLSGQVEHDPRSGRAPTVLVLEETVAAVRRGPLGETDTRTTRTPPEGEVAVHHLRSGPVRDRSREIPGPHGGRRSAALDPVGQQMRLDVEVANEPGGAVDGVPVAVDEQLHHPHATLLSRDARPVDDLPAGDNMASELDHPRISRGHAGIDAQQRMVIGVGGTDPAPAEDRTGDEGGIPGGVVREIVNADLRGALPLLDELPLASGQGCGERIRGLLAELLHRRRPRPQQELAGGHAPVPVEDPPGEPLRAGPRAVFDDGP